MTSGPGGPGAQGICAPTRTSASRHTKGLVRQVQVVQPIQ